MEAAFLPQCRSSGYAALTQAGCRLHEHADQRLVSRKDITWNADGSNRDRGMMILVLN